MTTTYKNIIILLAISFGLSLFVYKFVDVKNKSIGIDSSNSLVIIEAKSTDSPIEVTSESVYVANNEVQTNQVQEKKSTVKKSRSKRNKIQKKEEVNTEVVGNVSDATNTTENFNNINIDSDQPAVNSTNNSEDVEFTVKVSNIDLSNSAVEVHSTTTNDIEVTQDNAETNVIITEEVAQITETPLVIDITETATASNQEIIITEAVINEVESELENTENTTTQVTPLTEEDVVEITETEVTEIEIEVSSISEKAQDIATTTNDNTIQKVDNESVIINSTRENTENTIAQVTPLKEEDVIETTQVEVPTSSNNIPFSQTITLNVDIDNNANIEVSYVDQKGKLISTSSLSNLDKGVQKITLDTSDLNSGTYQIYVNDVANNKTIKTLQYFKM